MYTLRCYNKFSSIEKRFTKKEFTKMKKYAEKICKNFEMKYEYRLEE